MIDLAALKRTLEKMFEEIKFECYLPTPLPDCPWLKKVTVQWHKDGKRYGAKVKWDDRQPNLFVPSPFSA